VPFDSTKKELTAEDSDDMAWLEYSLLGTSEKQQQLMKDQKEELKRGYRG